MHFPEAVHLGQSEASQLVSVQLLDRKISLWLIRQSCSDVQLTELLMQAPSGQFVHHLHCRAGCENHKRFEFTDITCLSLIKWCYRIEELYITCDGLENVFGCRARHSLQVFSLRHWSGWRGVGEQGDGPVKQPILIEREKFFLFSSCTTAFISSARCYSFRAVFRKCATSQQYQKKHMFPCTIRSCLWWCCRPLGWAAGHRGQRAQTGLGVCPVWHH